MASAAFTLNGSSSPLAVSAGATVTLALTSDVGVRSVTWEIIGGSDSSKATPTITPSGFGASFTMTTPVSSASGVAWIVRCKVNGGVDDEGRVVSALTQTGIVGVYNGSGYLPFPVGETFERNATHGIADDMNAQFGLLAGGGSLVSTSTTGTVSQLGSASTVLTTDGATPGGAWSLIANANVDAAAAIAGTKISPNFGAQNVVTTGTLSAGATTLTSLGVSGLSTLGTGGSGSVTLQHSGTTVLTTAADGVVVSGGASPRVLVDNGTAQGEFIVSSSVVVGSVTAHGLTFRTTGVSRLWVGAGSHVMWMPDATSRFNIGDTAAAWTGYLGLGGIPGSSGTNGTGLRAATGSVRLPGFFTANVRNAADTADLTLLQHGASNAFTVGNTTGSTTVNGSTTDLKHAGTTVLATHSAGVSLGTGTVAGTGTVRGAHGFSAYARNNGDSGNAHLLSFGSAATDDLYVGDSSYDTVIRGQSVTIQNAGTTVLNTAVGVVELTANKLRWVQGATSPRIEQVAAAASTAGVDLEIEAQNTITSGFPAGDLILRGGGAAASGDFGNIGLGPAPSSWGGMARGVHLYNSSAAPTSNPTTGIYVYAESGAGKARGTSGTVTTWAPAEPHCPRCGRDFAHEWQNDTWGEKLSVCVSCLVDALDRHGVSPSEYVIERQVAA